MSTPPFQPGQSNEVGGIFYSLVFGDGTVQTTAAVSAAQGGTVPSVLYKSFKTAQTAALSAVSLVPASANKGGMWRINYVATVTTVDSSSFTLGGTTGFQDTFTNGNGDNVVKTSNPTSPAVSAANTTGTAVSGVKLGYTKAGTAITYAFGYTAGNGNGAYDIAVYAEYLG